MARNGSGTYSLPAGNPVIDGTTIEPAWANDTLDDVATGLTNSLDRGGRGAMTAPLQLANGTVSLPGLTFGTEPSSGIYRVGAGNPALAVLGNIITSWTATGLTVTGAMTSTTGVVTGLLTAGSLTLTTDLAVADGGTGASDAATARANLGAGTGDGDGDALVANPLSQFAATTSAQLAGVLSDETGTGVAVFGTDPTLTGATLAGELAGADNTVSRVNLKDYGEVTNAIGSVGGGAQTIDLESGNSVTATIDTSTTTFTFSNPTASDERAGFTLTLTNGGSQTVNWPASVDWPGGVAPTLTASGVDVLVFETVDGGTIWYGNLVGAAYA